MPRSPEALEAPRSAGRCDLPGVTCDAGFYPALPFAPLKSGLLSCPCGLLCIIRFWHLANTGHTGANAAFHGLEGARMPPSLQEGNKRAYNAKQGL